jgi:hypothetical protein
MNILATASAAAWGGAYKALTARRGYGVHAVLSSRHPTYLSNQTVSQRTTS